MKSNVILVEPFKYKILINPNIKKGNYFSITYKEGTKYYTKLLPENFVSVYTQKKLTKQQLLEMFDRTDGIIGIRGDFEE